MSFDLHPTLAQDSLTLLDLDLSQVRLMNNAIFPWVLLIPKRNHCVEILDLNAQDRVILYQEMLLVAETMKTLFKPTKLNIANLGNQVAQLHVHVIARYDSDPAWPNPVWGAGFSREYTSAEKENRLAQLQDALKPILPLGH